jgi:hypothetical protein
MISKLKENYFSKYEDIMALSGINSTAFNNKNRNHPMTMPFESPILRKLAFSKLVDATTKRAMLTRIIQRELMQKTRKCLRSL